MDGWMACGRVGKARAPTYLLSDTPPTYLHSRTHSLHCAAQEEKNGPSLIHSFIQSFIHSFSHSLIDVMSHV